MVRCALIMDGQSLPWWWASACQYARQPAGPVPVDEGVGSNLPRAPSGDKVPIVVMLQSLAPARSDSRPGLLFATIWMRVHITRRRSGQQSRFLPLAIAADRAADSAVAQLYKSRRLARSAKSASRGFREPVNPAPLRKSHNAIIIERAVALALILAAYSFRRGHDGSLSDSGSLFRYPPNPVNKPTLISGIEPRTNLL